MHPAHHAAREMTRMNYMQIGSVPLMIFTQGTWTGYGIYEAAQLAVPLTFLQFSRQFEDSETLLSHTTQDGDNVWLGIVALCPDPLTEGIDGVLAPPGFTRISID